MINVGTIPENFSFTDVYTFHVDELPSLLVARRAAVDELIWDADGGFTDQWNDRSSVEGNPDDGYDFHIARRSFSVAGLPIFASGTAGGGGATTLAGDVDGPSGANVVHSIQGTDVDLTSGSDTDVLTLDGGVLKLLPPAPTGDATSIQGEPVPAPTPGVLTFDGTDLSWNVAAGTGDVVGPASAVDDRVATFNTTTGKLIQDGGKTIAEIEASAAAKAGWKRVADINFTQLGSVALGTDGGYTIGGVPFRVRGNANASSFAIDSNGVRIQLNANSSANYFLDASTGPVLAIRLRELCPDFVLGQSELRMWCLAGNNGNQNHENCGFGFALNPWNGGGSTTNWYQVLAFGAYDSLAPHNGIITGHGSSGNATSRVDKDLTAVTVANDPTRSLWGMHFKDVGVVNFYTRSLTSSAIDTDLNDTVNKFEDMLLRAKLMHYGYVASSSPPLSDYRDNGGQILLDPGASWLADQADDIQLLICSLSSYNTTGHLLHTTKRLVIEYKP